jgi:hypothetical protein
VTDSAVTLLLAVLQVGTAVGIVVFWTSWLRTDHDPSTFPEGFLLHERAFVVPDGVLAVLLTASGLLSVLEQPLGPRLALVAAGMLLFLGLLDATYFALTGLFARDRGGLGNAAIVSWMLLLAALLALRHLATS